ncbi:MAG: hypothetical protein HQL21_04690 [Candidatus Omnitrophica bacterium]|nr:hypothetical protein [Candidatus Omnitrophota bacterium]
MSAMILFIPAFLYADSLPPRRHSCISITYITLKNILWEDSRENGFFRHTGGDEGGWAKAFKIYIFIPYFGRFLK